jgi:hypothetical protein
MQLRTKKNEEYQDLFEEIMRMAGIPESSQVEINYNSAVFRTYLMLAATILHEFTHAFVMAYFDNPDPYAPQEPWTPGDRCNEQGFAFENFALGGLIEPMRIGIPPMSHNFLDLQKALAPFGLSTTRQWDVWECNVEGAFDATMDSDRTGVERVDFPPNYIYPVPQVWTQWLFSDDCWQDRVRRYGLRVIEVHKLESWEMPTRFHGSLGRHSTGEERWNNGEDKEDLKRWPNWDNFYLDGIPREERIYKRPKWEP